MRRARRAAVAALSAAVLGALLVTGCSRPDPALIIGKWKAESFAIDGLKVPLAPNFEVTRNEIVLRGSDGREIQTMKLSAIRAKSDQIELDLQDASGFSLVFDVENDQRVHFRVPLVGVPIAFDKQR